jgi:site-specific DNA-methyltransferase (adenine-specific)
MSLPKPYYQDSHCTIYHGDCREILPQLEPVDLVLTDPPYLLPQLSGGGAFGNRDSLQNTRGFTDKGINYDFLSGFSNWFVFCNFAQLEELLCVAKKMPRRNLITMCKSNPVPTVNNKYLPDVEYVVHGFNKNRLFGNYKHKSCFEIVSVGGKETKHPNEKPIVFVKRLVVLGSKEGETILDPFMGSGTTLRAAKDLNRKAIGIEIEEKYCEIAVERLRQEVLAL